MNFSEKLPFPKYPDEEKNPDEKKESQDKRKDNQKIKKEEKEKEKKELFYVEVTEQCQWGGSIIPAFTMASSPESAQYNVRINYNKKRERKIDNYVKMKQPILYSSMSKEEKESIKKYNLPATLRFIGKLSGGGGEVLSDPEKDGEYYVLEPGHNVIHKPTEDQQEEIRSSLLEKIKDNQ